MDIQKSSFLSIEQMSDLYLNKGIQPGSQETAVSFEEILARKALDQTGPAIGNLKFSKHASLRLADRNIDLSREQLTRLEAGTWKAKQKGIKDSLVIVDDLAFIVNVPNNMVVTAMDSTDTNDNVFTNINGAVII